MAKVGSTEAGRQGGGAHAGLSLARALGAALDPAARRRGFAASTLLADWGLVVGPGLAARCQPVLLEGRGGVLHLHASGGAALEIQHAAPQLMDRVNTYFGFVAVRRLRLVQAPLAPARRPPEPPPVRVLAPEEEALVGRSVAGVDDPDLRAALLGLGRTLRGTTRR